MLFKSMGSAKLIWAGILLGIDTLFVTPTLSLLSVVLITIALDFLTGVMKAKFKKKARTSEGYRKTVIKFSQYILPVIVLYAGKNLIPEYKSGLTQASGYLMMFIIYIEVTSIFENLYEIDNKTVIAKYLYKPVLALLKLGIENNPVITAADKATHENNKTKNDEENTN